MDSPPHPTICASSPFASWGVCAEATARVELPPEQAVALQWPITIWWSGRLPSSSVTLADSHFDHQWAAGLEHDWYGEGSHKLVGCRGGAHGPSR